MSKIFISHAEKDAELIVRPFVDLLVMGLGIDRSEIYFTSDGDIPTGSNFPEHIKANINVAELVVIILTDNYVDSHFCLNEMGAAWANNQNIYPIIIPPVSYKILDRSALRGVTNVLAANEDDLQKMRDELENKKLTGKIRSQEYRIKCKIFLRSIEKYNKQIKIKGPNTVPSETYHKLQKELDELTFELEEKIKEFDSKDALIETLKKLKDQKEVKRILLTQNFDEWDELKKYIEQVKSLLDELDSMMVSLIYHFINFQFPFTPEYDEGWTTIHKLATRKFIFQDERKITINNKHPMIKETLSAIDILQDAIGGMSEEVYNKFEDEYGLEPDLSNIEFWEKVFSVRGMEVSR